MFPTDSNIWIFGSPAGGIVLRGCATCKKCDPAEGSMPLEAALSVVVWLYFQTPLCSLAHGNVDKQPRDPAATAQAFCCQVQGLAAPLFTHEVVEEYLRPHHILLIWTCAHICLSTLSILRLPNSKCKLQQLLPPHRTHSWKCRYNRELNPCLQTYM